VKKGGTGAKADRKRSRKKKNRVARRKKRERMHGLKIEDGVFITREARVETRRVLQCAIIAGKKGSSRGTKLLGPAAEEKRLWKTIHVERKKREGKKKRSDITTAGEGAEDNLHHARKRYYESHLVHLGTPPEKEERVMRTRG